MNVLKFIHAVVVVSVVAASGAARTPIFAADARPAVSANLPSVADSVAERLRRLSPIASDDVVWLARCIYSESNRPHEQRLVAWVVRNRVETRYRGSTYREVILEARQFSAFNEPTQRRERILNLSPTSTFGPWQKALEIALDVYQAPGSDRPFPQTVRHFYSPVSMRGSLQPHWADDGIEIASSSIGVDPSRFRFFNNVDEERVGERDAGIASSGGSATDRTKVESDGSAGFLFPIRRGSGRVARPRRPSIRGTRGR